LELEKHQDSYIDTLVSLKTAYDDDADAVTEQLKQELSQSADSYKLGRAQAISDALGLVESAPTDRPAIEFFNEKVKTQKEAKDDE
jgi:hypothetical protein